MTLITSFRFEEIYININLIMRIGNLLSDLAYGVVIFVIYINVVGQMFGDKDLNQPSYYQGFALTFKTISSAINTLGLIAGSIVV
jgi:hypothetical protein